MCFLAALCWMLAGLAGTVTGFLTSEGRFEQALLAQVQRDYAETTGAIRVYLGKN